LTDDCKIKIPICYYQPWELPKNDIFLPIQAGKAVSKYDLKMQGDDTECNISEKNAVFGEFTVWYWVWKNIKKLYPDLEYIGLSHYRRFFDLEHPSSEFSVFRVPKIPNMNGYGERFIDKLSSADIILPKPAFFSCDVKSQHLPPGSVYQCIKEFMHEICPEYDEAFRAVFENNNGISLYCIFISRYELFDDYFSWLFRILFEAEKRPELFAHTGYEKRYLAFFAERLLSVYVLHHKLRVQYEPLYFISPNINYRNGIVKLCESILRYCTPHGLIDSPKRRSKEHRVQFAV